MATKKYEHIGILPLEIPQGDRTLRVETGETFDADLPAELEGFFLQVGLIRTAETSRVPSTATMKTGKSTPVVKPPADGEKE